MCKFESKKKVNQMGDIIAQYVRYCKKKISQKYRVGYVDNARSFVYRKM